MEQLAKETVVIWGDSLAKGVIWNDARKRHAYSNPTAADIAAERLGIDIINGIVNGLKSAAGAVIDFMKNLAASALDTIKSFFGIASPSKLMAKEVGRWIPPGIVVGMDKAMPAALRDIKATASEITSQIQAALLGGQNGMRLSYATAAGGSEAVAAGNVYHYSQVVNTHDSLSPRELTEEHEAMKAREGWQLA